MAINREYKCTFHEHEFESTEERPACPFGCSAEFVVLEFRTPFAIRNRSTMVADQVTRQIASDYGMSDVRVDKDGTSAMSNTYDTSGGARHLGNTPKAYFSNEMHPVQQGWAQRGDPAPVFNTDPRKFRPPQVKQGNRYVDRYIPISHIQQGASRHLRNATRIMGPPGKKS